MQAELCRAAQLQAWFLVCYSAEVRAGQAVARDFLGRPIVLFRGAAGSVAALDAHCSHMGAHLGRGSVAGDCLRCPLHHWEYDGQGVCRRVPGAGQIPQSARQTAYAVAERYGGVFVFNGPQPLFEPPNFSVASEGELCVTAGRAVSLRCSWLAVAANGFDMQHLQTVHERALREPPRVEVPESHCFQLHYVSRVVGNSAVDRTMRRLARDRIAVTMTCWGGTVVMIESDLGRTRSALLLGLLPGADGVQVRPIFGVYKSKNAGADRLRVAVARWLFSDFLARDVAIMDEMRFNPHPILPHDEVLQRFLHFTAGLPRTPDAARDGGPMSSGALPTLAGSRKDEA